MEPETGTIPDNHRYRVDLCAYEGLGYPRGYHYYEFIAASDQEAERKVGSIGSRELEVFKDGLWQCVH